MRRSRSTRSARSAATAFARQRLAVAPREHIERVDDALAIGDRREHAADAPQVGIDAGRYVLSSTGRTRRMTARIFLTRLPRVMNGLVALRVADRLEFRRGEIKLSQDNPPNFTGDCLPRLQAEPHDRPPPSCAYAANLPTFSSSRAPNASSTPSADAMTPILAALSTGPVASTPGREEQRDRKAARRGERDDQQFAPADVTGQMQAGGERQADRREHAERPADQRGQRACPTSAVS